MTVDGTHGLLAATTTSIIDSLTSVEAESAMKLPQQHDVLGLHASSTNSTNLGN